MSVHVCVTVHVHVQPLLLAGKTTEWEVDSKENGTPVLLLGTVRLSGQGEQRHSVICLGLQRQELRFHCVASFALVTVGDVVTAAPPPTPLYLIHHLLHLLH